MGKVISKATRPIRNFNIENRVQKVIQTEKPRPAPRHPTTVAAYESHAKGTTFLLTVGTSKVRPVMNYI